MRVTRREVLNALVTGIGCYAGSGPLGRSAAALEVASRRPLVPLLEGPWWLIGASPDLDAVLPRDALLAAPPGPNSLQAARFAEELRQVGMSESWIDNTRRSFSKHAANVNEPVDHHLFQDGAGRWHLWGCVRRTAVGRVLYHWVADTLEQSPWTPTGEIIRCDRRVGESLNVRTGEEVIQSPYFVHDQDRYYMFYGGYSTGLDRNGNEEVDDGPAGFSRAEGQICLMTSPDGLSWERHRDAQGYSRVFAGPAGARDPCIIKIGDNWHLYYAGFEQDFLTGGGCYVRTSRDLITWSDYRLVHRDASRGGPMSFTHECPHVVYRGGYFYLFRTENYYDAITHVYRSEDPMDFGIDSGDKFVTTIACAAPEIYEIGGREYVSSNHDPALGTQLSRLRWAAA